MIIYILLTLVTVLLSLMVSGDYKRIEYGYSRQRVINKVCILCIFLLLFLVLALRINVGNDYAHYVEYFHLIRCKLDTDVVVPTEFGFNLVCLAIYFLSGKTENYLLMFAVFAFLTIWLFLKGIKEQSESFPFTFFLFMTLGFYFQSLSTVRYYFVLALAFASIPYLLRKEYLKFILLMLLGACFHKSMLLVIPMYLLASIPWKKWQFLPAGAVIASLVFFKDFYLKLFLLVYPTYEDTEYLEGGTSTIAIIRCVVILVFALIMFRKIKEDRTLSFYFYCNLGALVLYVFCSFLPSISRAGYYLTITQILFIPALIKRIENDKLRRTVTVLTVLACLGYFAVFLVYKAPADGLRILPYQTFLYHDMVPILSDVS